MYPTSKLPVEVADIAGVVVKQPIKPTMFRNDAKSRCRFTDMGDDLLWLYSR